MKRMLIILTILCVSVLSACHGSDRKELVEKYTLEHSQFLTIHDNLVHFVDEGTRSDAVQAKQETIVLLHGTASSLHAWNAWAEALSGQYRVVRMDLPGFGLTGPDPLDRYEVAEDVAFLKAFIARVVNGPVHLVGSSLGGRIAWAYSLEYPDSVRSLTLLDALGYPQERWPLPIALAQWPVLDEVFARVSPRIFFSSALKEVYFDDSIVDEALIDRYHELAHFPGNLDAFPKRVKAKLDTQSSLISEVTVPTLIMWGTEDIYFPVANAYRFQRDIAGAHLHVYTDVGHLPMEEIPQKSVRDYQAFLQQFQSESSAAISINSDVVSIN